jgi:hypothetical protein
MTPSEMEEPIKNLNQWASEVAHYLPRLATKDDLKAFATKDDLKAFATKDDLKAFATKDDLRAFATKDDLKAFATKEDLKAGVEDAKRYTENLTLVTRREIRQLDDKVTAVSSDVRQIAEHLAILTARKRKKR